MSDPRADFFNAYRESQFRGRHLEGAGVPLTEVQNVDRELLFVLCATLYECHSSWHLTFNNLEEQDVRVVVSKGEPQVIIVDGSRKFQLRNTYGIHLPVDAKGIIMVNGDNKGRYPWNQPLRNDISDDVNCFVNIVEKYGKSSEKIVERLRNRVTESLLPYLFDPYFGRALFQGTTPSYAGPVSLNLKFRVPLDQQMLNMFEQQFKMKLDNQSHAKDAQQKMASVSVSSLTSLVLDLQAKTLSGQVLEPEALMKTLQNMAKILNVLIFYKPVDLSIFEDMFNLKLAESETRVCGAFRLFDSENVLQAESMGAEDGKTTEITVPIGLLKYLAFASLVILFNLQSADTFKEITDNVFKKWTIISKGEQDMAIISDALVVIFTHLKQAQANRLQNMFEQIEHNSVFYDNGSFDKTAVEEGLLNPVRCLAETVTEPRSLDQITRILKVEPWDLTSTALQIKYFHSLSIVASMTQKCNDELIGRCIAEWPF